MGRPLRMAPGNFVYHVLNRANGRVPLFEDDGDYAACERVMAEACDRMSMRVLAYCLMPNHWHLVLWPRHDGDLSRFMAWLTLTHTQRWHTHHHTVGHGHLYQGRFKSFVVEQDEHLLTVCRYVERNALRAGLVERAEHWRWGSAWQRGGSASVVPLSDGPTERAWDWVHWLNTPQTDTELAAIRQSVTKGQPFGSLRWMEQMVTLWWLGSTLRFRGRPKKELVGNGSWHFFSFSIIRWSS